MENCDRENIRKNISDLIRTTNYDALANALVINGVISKVMRDRIDNLCDAEEDEKHRQLFIKVTKRGPTAFTELLKILIDLKFDSATRLLRPIGDNHVSINTRNASNNQRIPFENLQSAENSRSCLPEGCYPSKNLVDSKRILQPYTTSINLPTTFNVVKSTVIHFDKTLPVYPMKSKNRGVFFMVNIMNFPHKELKKRSGAELDSKYMLRLFQEFGFICFSYEDLEEKEFFDLLEELRTSDYLKQSESFVMALMTHGDMKDDMHDRVEFYGGSIVKVKKIEDFFSNLNCKSLIMKPKVLIFPFCRGDHPDTGFDRSIETDSIEEAQPRVSRQMETVSDMLVCYATVRGFQSLRDPDEGSWYIQTFCKILANNAHNMHLEDMLKLIATKIKSLRSTEAYLQTPAYSNHGFDKLLFFNPGAYEE